MKAATLNEIKKELKTLTQEELVDLCTRLARFKKENKELLTYLLFEASDELSYINSVKEEIREEFQTLNKSNLYLAKKTIRKVLRVTKKYIRYSGKKETEIELLIFYCQQLKETGLPLKQSKVLKNLYERQVETIRKAQLKIHEDLQFDYEEDISCLPL